MGQTIGVIGTPDLVRTVLLLRQCGAGFEVLERSRWRMCLRGFRRR